MKKELRKTKKKSQEYETVINIYPTPLQYHYILFGFWYLFTRKCYVPVKLRTLRDCPTRL